jgi:antiviral helicase SLH1
MSDEALQPVLASVRDETLRLSLPFGIGLHHAGLVESDRRTVEELFVNRKIQVATAGHGIVCRSACG